ncbi:MAG TPA: FlgD immunoglobulin-like domain containing protein [Puia sp.]|jgi:hypothetical protein|nr:FlgD immunoglobulin-like domain containing protein [Puia sp.]
MKTFLQKTICTSTIAIIIFFATANGQIAPDLDIGHPCFFIVPANLVADSISSSSARLNATIRESRIVFKYKAVSSDAWLSSTPVDPSWIHSLSPATNYEFYAIGTSTCPSSSTPITKTSSIAYFTTLKAPSSKASVSSLTIYPVPIQNSTTVSFTLAEPKEVFIKVFDMTGRPVKTIAGAQLQPGDHQFLWNGKDEKGNALNTGIYFLRIETEDYSETRKIIMVR